MKNDGFVPAVMKARLEDMRALLDNVMSDREVQEITDKMNKLFKDADKLAEDRKLVVLQDARVSHYPDFENDCLNIEVVGSEENAYAITESGQMEELSVVRPAFEFEGVTATIRIEEEEE